MKFFVKKIVSTSLCAILLATSTLCAYAAEKDYNTTTGAVSSDYQVLAQTDTIPANTIRMYVYGNAVSSFVRKGIEYKNTFTGEKTEIRFDSTKPYIDVTLPSENKEYKTSNILEYAPNGDSVTESCKVGADIIYLCDTDETYEKVRVKLSAFNKPFNNDGSYDKQGVNFTFGSAKNSRYASLVIFSGCAITLATPDANGYVEFYRSKKISDVPMYSTAFISLEPEKSFYGSGATVEVLRGMRVGDVDGNGFISIQDATELQKHLAGFYELDSLGFERADVNNDDIINVTDATLIQRHLAM